MSQNLQQACSHFVATEAIEELAEILERDAFELWKTQEPADDAAARIRYLGQQDVIQIIRNFAVKD